MLHIDIREIPHKNQRYKTCGDYFFKGTKLLLRASHMKDWRYVFLVALHELVEWSLITWKGIKIKDIDEFDKKYEADREKGIHSAEDEPGDDLKAPYFYEHQFASRIEKMMADELNVDWSDYSDAVMSL